MVGNTWIQKHPNSREQHGAQSEQRFLCRRTRTLLPTRADQLLPGTDYSGVREDLQRRQRTFQKSFDTRAHTLKPLVVGQVVRVQPSDMEGSDLRRRSSAKLLPGLQV